MLSGSTGLTHANLAVEMLEFLPVSGRTTLKSLCLDACIEQAEAVPDIINVVSECQQLESLTIRCPLPGWHLPELDLQHLAHLRKCGLENVPAPGRVKLSFGKGQLSTSVERLAAWSKLRLQWRDCVYSISVCAWLDGPLQAWPEGITAFHGLQFLTLIYKSMVPSTSSDILDLAHFAHIPHLPLHSMGKLTVKISRGNWKVLQLESEDAFNVGISDVEAFMKSTGAFLFKFPSASGERPHVLIEQLRKAGSDMGTVIYEYPITDKTFKANQDTQFLILSKSRFKQQAGASYSVDFVRACADYEKGFLEK